MKRYRWQILLGISLVVLSALLYLIHYAIFRDTYHIFIYMLGDIAFIPAQVLIVTLIIDRFLREREKRTLLKKLNMVIGAFFSEVGMELLESFSSFDPNADRITPALIVTNDWSEAEFATASQNIKGYAYETDALRGDLADLKRRIVGKRGFLLRLLENPNLLEHESFTELLWAVFHLTEELACRKDVKRLPDSDYAHLALDIKRAYSLLISAWLDYMNHLKKDYPYLFSLALRTNPFDPNASPVVA
ncbi:hypothetical protein ACFLU4_00640 [Chloroflexota bacterium]